MWNPPLTDRELGLRRSALGEAAELIARLVRDGARLICFMKSRKGVELLSRLVGDDLAAHRSRARRAGRALSRRLHRPAAARARGAPDERGAARDRDTTDALELGIDIGQLDAAVVVTFPGTVASLRQMWGRAGRSGGRGAGRGLALFLAGEDALDQFFARHPEEFLERPVEAAILDHESPSIYRQHLLCAAHEGPLSHADAEFLGPRWEAHAEVLVSAGELRARPPGADRAGRAARHGGEQGQGGTATAGPTYVPRRAGSYPAAEVSLRSSSAESFAIVDVSTGELLGSDGGRARARDDPRPARSTCTWGRATRCASSTSSANARSSHRSRAISTRSPSARPTPRSSRLLDRREALGVTAVIRRGERDRHGPRLPARRLSDHTPIGIEALELPAMSFDTQALWFELDAEALTHAVPLDALLGALHATEHAQIAVLPLIAMCDRWDIGGLSTNFHPQTGGPTIFIYDGHPGGIGITRLAFSRFEELCEDASRLIAGCPCSRAAPRACSRRSAAT